MDKFLCLACLKAQALTTEELSQLKAGNLKVEYTDSAGLCYSCLKRKRLVVSYSYVMGQKDKDND